MKQKNGRKIEDPAMQEAVLELLKTGIQKLKNIIAICGSDRKADQIIDQLSIDYPIYSPRNGYYKLLTEEDLNDYRKEIQENGRR